MVNDLCFILLCFDYHLLVAGLNQSKVNTSQWKWLKYAQQVNNSKKVTNLAKSHLLPNLNNLFQSPKEF